MNQSRPTSTSWLGSIWGAAQTALKITRTALPRMLSFSFSASIFITGTMISRQPEADDDYLSGSTLSTTEYYTLVTCSIVHIIAMANYIAQRRPAVPMPNSQTESSQIEAIPSINPTNTQLVPTKYKEIATAPRNSLLITLPLYGISATLLIVSELVLTDVLQQPARPAGLAQQFLRPAAATLLAMVGHMILSQLFFAFELQDAEMVFSMTGLAVGSLTGYGFSFKLGWGIPAIAYGWLVGESTAVVLSAVYVKLNRSFEPFEFFKESFQWHEHDKQQMLDLYEGGKPLTKTFVSELSASLLLNNWIIGWLCEPEALPALNFVYLLDSAEMLQYLALAMTTMLLVSKASGHRQNMQHITRVGLGLSLIWVGSQVLLAANFPDTYRKIISSYDNAAVNQLFKQLLWAYAAKIGCDTWRQNMLMPLMAVGDFQVPANLSVGGMWLGFGIATAVAATKKSVVWTIYGFNSGLAFSNLLLTIRWWQKFKPSQEAQSSCCLCPSLRFMSRNRLNTAEATASLLKHEGGNDSVIHIPSSTTPSNTQ